MSIDEAILRFLSAALTPLVAIVATVIAFQQFLINKRKLKLDLFEKRFEVFGAVLDFIDLIATRQLPKQEDIVRLDRARLTSRFLFNSEVPKLIAAIREKAQVVSALDSRAKEVASLGGGELLLEARKSQEELLKWFEEQRGQSERVFEKYLKIEA